MTPLSRTLNHPLWLIALVLLTVAYFGSGVYKHYSAEREARVRVAQEKFLTVKLDKMKAGTSTACNGYTVMKVGRGR